MGISTETAGNDTQCVTAFLKEVSLARHLRGGEETRNEASVAANVAAE